MLPLSEWLVIVIDNTERAPACWENKVGASTLARVVQKKGLGLRGSSAVFFDLDGQFGVP